MPTIEFSDGSGLTITATPAQSSGLRRYLMARGIALTAGGNLAELAATPVGSLNGKGLRRDLSLGEDFSLGNGEADLAFSAHGSGWLQIAGSGATVADQELLGKSVVIPEGRSLIGIGLMGKVSANASRTVSDVTFGISAGESLTLSSYLSLPAETSLASAVRESLTNFLIAGDVEDLRGMPEGSVCQVTGEGSLNISGSFDVVSAWNPLAHFALGAVGNLVTLQASASASFGVTAEISGEYRIRVEKVSGREVEIGYYRKAGRALTVSLVASVDSGAKLDSGDWMKVLLGFLSTDVQSDAAALKEFGVPDAQREVIASALKSGVERTMKASLEAELSSMASDEAAFLYRIDLEILDLEGQRAVNAALDGDLSLMNRMELGGEVPGIQALRSACRKVREQGISLRVNLFGAYSYASIAKMLSESTAVLDAEEGTLSILDKATATRLKLSTVNFGEAAERIRKLILSLVIPSVAYRASGAGSTVSASTSMLYFEEHSRTSPRTMKDNLDIFEACGQIAAERKQQIMASATDFGRSRFILRAEFDDSAATALFLDSAGLPRPAAYYQRAGRDAILALIQPGEPDDYRRRAVENNALWRRMCDSGQAALASVLPRDLRQNQFAVQVIQSDYSLIVWWAESMASAARALHGIRRYFDQGNAVDPGNHEFSRLQKELRKTLAKVASETKPQFGDAWGLVAMYLATPVKPQIEGALQTALLTVYADA